MTYPEKPVRLIVSRPPGSQPDIVGRLVGQKFAETWGKAVVIENIAGAAGNIAIPKQIFRSTIPREGFDHLLGCPLRGWIPGNVEMNHLAPVMQEDDQEEQNFELDGGNRKEVDRYEIRDVFVQERAPRRGRRFAQTDSILKADSYSPQ